MSCLVRHPEAATGLVHLLCVNVLREETSSLSPVCCEHGKCKYRKSDCVTLTITLIFEAWLSDRPVPEARRGEEMFFSTSTEANQGLIFGIAGIV